MYTLREHCPNARVFPSTPTDDFSQRLPILYATSQTLASFSWLRFILETGIVYTAFQSKLAEVCQAVPDKIDAHDHLSLLGPVDQRSPLAIMHFLQLWQSYSMLWTLLLPRRI